MASPYSPANANPEFTMTQQYIRKASLIIGAGSDALDLSKMQFTFNVQAAVISTPTTAFIRVFNLSGKTARRVTEEGELIILSAGYGGNFNTIFQGQITQARIGRENGTDTYLDITAADGDQIYNFAVVNFSVAAGSNAIGRLRMLATAAGMPEGTIQAPENGPKLSRGVVYFGLVRDCLRQECASIGTNWSINDGKLDVIAEGGYKEGEIPVITSATGMIGVPEQNGLGISFKCLLNPHLRKDERVQIDNALIRQFGYTTSNLEIAKQFASIPTLTTDGIYKILYVNHYGDTRGNDWYSDVVASSDIKNKAQLQFMPKIS
ncbi:phage protein [Nitrosospira lacus]|nr:hypothetical protein [Nitrosospira lacus]